MAEAHQETLSAREFKKNRNREILLEAASKALHRHGLKGSTIDVIQRYSGLGRGMINQHFESKDRLLWAVAELNLAEYRANWQNALQTAGPTAQDKLRALCVAEFSEDVLTHEKASIWLAFRSEVSASAEYQDLIASSDREFTDTLRDLCREICETGGHSGTDPDIVARLLAALIEGFWAEFHLAPDAFDRAGTSAICIDVARKYLPSL